MRIDRWGLWASLILFLMAVPLLLFVMVNSELIPEISLPFMTVPKMGGYRGSEIALTVSGMWQNLRKALSLLWHQNNGSAFDILLPWGLFYDIGRIFIIAGTFSLLTRLFLSFRKKEFCPEFFLFVQLLGGGIVCLLVSAVLHQINALYIPLVLVEAYGVWTVTELAGRKKAQLTKILSCGLAFVYLICLGFFQKDYYTDYREVVSAYFAEGVEDCVHYALEQCSAREIDSIIVEKGAQWPRLLLYTETLPSQYLSSVIYNVAPAPASFETEDGIRIHIGIDYENIRSESIYIIYYIDVPDFENDFTLTPFHDWYVAVPKQD